MDPIEICVSRKRILLALCICSVSVALGGWLLFSPGFANRWVARAIGAMCVIIFSFYFLGYISRLFRRKPVVVLEPAGIELNLPDAVPFVSWGDVLRIEIVRVNRVRYLVIHALDPSHYRGQRPFIMKLNQALAPALAEPSVIGFVKWIDIDCDVNDVASRILQYRQQIMANTDKSD